MCTAATYSTGGNYYLGTAATTSLWPSYNYNWGKCPNCGYCPACGKAEKELKEEYQGKHDAE